MFDDLHPEAKVDYLENCLPRKPFRDVVSDYDEYTEQTVDELVLEGKSTLISQMQQGIDHWEYLMENKDTLPQEYKEEQSYRSLAYSLSAMNDSGLATFPRKFSVEKNGALSELKDSDSRTIESLKEHLIANGDQSVEKAFSRVGADIWSDLGSEPTPRLAYFEDRDHLYTEFWMQTDSKKQFHERRGEFLEFPVLRKVVCRVHLDDEYVELRGRRQREKDKEAGYIALKEFLNDEISYSEGSQTATDGGRVIEITDDVIRDFYNLPEFQRLSHANKDGTATSSWTADDVRTDSRYPDSRPNNYNNLVFDIDPVGRVSFQLNAEDNSFQIFKQKIMPREHIQVSEYIVENI